MPDLLTDHLFSVSTRRLNFVKFDFPTFQFFFMFYKIPRTAFQSFFSLKTLHP